jgi:hypothetical protein
LINSSARSNIDCFAKQDGADALQRGKPAVEAERRQEVYGTEFHSVNFFNWGRLSIQQRLESDGSLGIDTTKHPGDAGATFLRGARYVARN